MGKTPKQTEGIGAVDQAAVLGKQHPLLRQGMRIAATHVAEHGAIGNALENAWPVLLQMGMNRFGQLDREIFGQVSEAQRQPVSQPLLVGKGEQTVPVHLAATLAQNHQGIRNPADRRFFVPAYPVHDGMEQ